MNLIHAYRCLTSGDAIIAGPHRKRLEDMLHTQTLRVIAASAPMGARFEWQLIMDGDPFTILHFIDLCGPRVRPHVNDALALSCSRGINADWLRHAGPTHCAHCESLGQLYTNHPEFHQAAKYCLILQFPLTRDLYMMLGGLLHLLSFKK